MITHRPLTIALVGPTFPFRGGIAHHTTLLYRALRERHEVVFRSFKRQYPRWLYPGESDRDESEGAPRAENVKYTLDSMNPYTWWKTAHELAKQRPDLVILPWWVVFWAPQFYALSRYLKQVGNVSVVFFCHNVQEHETNTIKRLATRQVLSGGDAFLCQSEAEADNLRSWFPDKIVRKVFHPTYAEVGGSPGGSPNGSPGGSPSGSPGESPSERESSGRDDAPNLLFFGFICDYKGLDVLLRAMPRIHRNTGAGLKVVGETWKEASDYEKLIEELEIGHAVDCEFRYVPNGELGDLFSETDLVVLPYRSATGCGVLQLAFGHGKPVVATRVGGIAESVREGVNGLLSAPEDPDALAEAVEQALEPGQLERLLEGVRASAQEFSWEALVDSLEEVYQALGEGDGGGARPRDEG